MLYDTTSCFNTTGCRILQCYVPPMNRSLLPLLAVCFIAASCTGGTRARSEQQGRFVDAEREYAIGDHGETGFLLTTRNRVVQPLHLSFYVLLPASHPSPDTLIATQDTVVYVSQATADNCAGLQKQVIVPQDSATTFESCFFDRVAERHTGLLSQSVTLKMTCSTAWWLSILSPLNCITETDGT